MTNFLMAITGRPSLPNVNKSRPNFTPKQLSVTSCSNDSTTLGPQKRNWSAGSGAAIHAIVIEGDKRSVFRGLHHPITCHPFSIRINKHKGKINSEVRQKDIVYGIENSDAIVNQAIEGCVSNFANCCLHPQSFSACSCQSTNSSENSSRSSSHSRSTPQIVSKEKLPDSKLIQSITHDLTLLSPIELFKEYSNTSCLCVSNHYMVCSNNSRFYLPNSRKAGMLTWIRSKSFTNGWIPILILTVIIGSL